MNACGSGCGQCGMCDGGGPPDATCEDCGAPVWLGRFDLAPFLCDECFTLRERWAAEQEAKIAARRMLKIDQVPGTLPIEREDVA